MVIQRAADESRLYNFCRYRSAILLVMKCSIRKPCSALAGYVMCLWSLEHRHRAGESCVQQMVPTGYVELELYFGGCARIAGADRQFNRQPSGLICGLQSAPTEVELSGDLGVIAVVLHPGAAGALLGLPAKLLSNARVDVVDIFGPDGARLNERIADAPSAEERFSLIEAFLVKRCTDPAATIDPVVHGAVQRISRSGGVVTIDEVARQIGISRRHLERKFAHSVGVPPKVFAKMLRFQRALALKQQDERISLTELAYAAGYADQAHFIHDFKSMTGLPPRAYFKREKAFSEFYAYCA